MKRSVRKTRDQLFFPANTRPVRTPNPCVMCNEKLKFGNLWQKAELLGCDYIATGHYAIIEHHHATKAIAAIRAAVLRKGIDSRKDQSYFLFRFAAGAIAACTHSTRSNVEIRNSRDCPKNRPKSSRQTRTARRFVSCRDRDYKAFLRSHLGENQFHPGGITI